MTKNLEIWDDEGGAPMETSADQGGTLMSGTANQVEWAQNIKRHVSAEFDRVAALLRKVATNQVGEMREQTDAVIEILEEKRNTVMAKERAGYFIHDWQEITDQVRNMLIEDPRYQAIKEKRSELRNQQEETMHNDRTD